MSEGGREGGKERGREKVSYTSCKAQTPGSGSCSSETYNPRNDSTRCHNYSTTIHLTCHIHVLIRHAPKVLDVVFQFLQLE